MWKFLIFTLLVAVTASENISNAVETEMFAVPISPSLFNWTYQEFDEQYRFHASLRGRPELPPWLRYVYSGRHHAGFIFGTPPRGAAFTSPITLEIIGLNRQDYETRRVLITLKIHPKENMARHEVELKIDNLNVEDLLDEHRMTRLKDILRTKLWTESKQDLYATFLSSAIDLGARLPLKPSDGEGLVVRLGSSAPFSTELKRLREEVRPLSRLLSCPRDYKRTTVERLFRDSAFSLDWCSFELYNTIYKERSTIHLEYLTEVPNGSATGNKIVAPRSWDAPARSALPQRAPGRPLATALAPPLLLLLLAAAALAAVLCSRYAAVNDPESEYFLENIYHICIDYRRKRAHKTGKVELCRYGTGNTEQTQVPDNTSNKSTGVSPSASLPRPYSPKCNLAGSYNRPEPPPYPPTSLRRRPIPLQAPLALEESLQLLNQANISFDPKETGTFDPKDRIIDHNDTAEDYVLVQRKPDLTGSSLLKPDLTGSGHLKQDLTGMGQLKPDLTGSSHLKPDLGYEPDNDLDDIDVPELAKYGVPGI